MKITNLLTSFSEKDLELNSPFVTGLHKLRYEHGNFHEVMLGYHESNTCVPFYTFSTLEVAHLTSACEKMYDALFDAVGMLFKEDISVIYKYFSGDFLRQYPQFIEYAKHTYQHQHPAIYGRYDMAYDTEGNLKFYEFNGDTPTMLFESSCVNHVMLSKVMFESYQLNFWQEQFIKNIPHLFKPGQTFAVVAKMDVTTDAMTAEYIYNTAVDEGVNAILLDISDLEYEIIDKKFHYQGQVFDAVYILKPWEEMVESSPDIISEWRYWSNDCKFFEPAWRWFTSNKGIWAYLYKLLTSTSPQYKEFVSKHQGVTPYVIPSYMPQDKPVELENYVLKPLIGRCSQSIKIFKDGKQVHDTGGWYSEVECLVQAWHPAPQLPDRDQFVTCMWMAPWDYGTDKVAMAATVLTVRECKGDITNIAHESVYPCMTEEPY